MLNTYIEASGKDEKQAKDFFTKLFKKGKIVYFKNGKDVSTTIDKFKAKADHYVKLADKYNTNDVASEEEDEAAEN
jgi:hypothetical protein